RRRGGGRCDGPTSHSPDEPWSATGGRPSASAGLGGTRSGSSPYGSSAYGSAGASSGSGISGPPSSNFRFLRRRASRRFSVSPVRLSLSFSTSAQSLRMSESFRPSPRFSTMLWTSVIVQKKNVTSSSHGTHVGYALATPVMSPQTTVYSTP